MAIRPLLLTALIGLFGACVSTQKPPTPAPPPKPAATNAAQFPQPKPPPAIPPLSTPPPLPHSAPVSPADPILPHLRFDRANRLIDLEATVIYDEGKQPWLELIACSPGSREHEALLTVPARPSHIHLALVLLGLEPGAPMSWHKVEDRIEILPPRGPRVAVTVLYEKDGQTVEEPIHHWVLNQHTRQLLESNVFLFAGSGFATIEEKKVYRADLEGTVLALVNFGDDLLTRDTTMTNSTDDASWVALAEAIPPAGTNVTLRLRPVEEARPADHESKLQATQPAPVGQSQAD